MPLENIPLELRQYNQFVVWRYEDTNGPKPTKVPYCPETNKLASVTDPNTWASFDDACAAVARNNWYSGIGFVLTDYDPFTFIDLDDTKGDAEAMRHQLKIYNEFESYAERSPSGNGLHIIVKGKLESGRRRSFVEIYSNARYMTMTGDVYRDAPINDYQELLGALWEQMGQGRSVAAFYAGIETAKDSDDEVCRQAYQAVNGEKFYNLYTGAWDQYYQSQSEADFALVDILAFYSHNKAQIARIFRASTLGQRDKAKRNDYVNYMLNKCFDRILPPVDFEGLKIKLDEAIARKLTKEKEPVSRPARAEEETPEQEDLKPKTSCYTVPPGLVGDIARFIYAQAPRPVPEIALAAALGMISGIVGRAYNISGTGLNQYTLLLAPTGTGKESMAKGIDRLFSAIQGTVPASQDFVGPAEIASSQAIIKYMSKGPTSFISVVGEFGIYLQQMANLNAPPHLLGLRRFLLDAYNKSGEGQSLHPSIYSDKDKNTHSVISPAFSLLGESTPEKFYEGLHEGLIQEGLLPRFTIIEYTGPRPPLNPNHTKAKPSYELTEKVATLCAHALMLNGQNKAINVEMDDSSLRRFNEFDVHCDMQINGSNKEARKQLWNRAHIKAMKLGALIAVGVNPYDPLIGLDVANWAIEIVVNDVKKLLEKFDSGEVGTDNDETKQLTCIIKAVKEYIVSPWDHVKVYCVGLPPAIHGARIVPYCYLQRKLASVAVFKKDRQGSSMALKRAIATLLERGDMREINRPQMQRDFDNSSRAFAVENLQIFNL